MKLFMILSLSLSLVGWNMITEWHWPQTCAVSSMNHNAHKCNRFNGCCLANGRMKIDASEPALYYNMIKSYRAARLECTTSAIDTHITLVLRSDWIKLLLLLLFLRLANYSTAGANICRNTSAHGGYYDWNKTTVHAAETTTIANCMDRPFVIIYDAAAECTSDLLFFFPAFSFQHTFWLQGHIQFMLTVSSSLLSNAMSASWALCSYASVGLSSVKKLASSIKYMCVSVIHDPWSMCHVLLWVGGFAPNECCHPQKTVCFTYSPHRMAKPMDVCKWNRILTELCTLRVCVHKFTFSFIQRHFFNAVHGASFICRVFRHNLIWSWKLAE